MKILKIICYCLLMTASFGFAKIKVEAIRLNRADLQIQNPLVLGLNETHLQLIDSILLEARCVEHDKMIFSLAFKLENGNFITFCRSDLLTIQDGDEISFNSTGDFSLVLRVSKVQ